MLIIAIGNCPTHPFSCALSYAGPIANADDAIRVLSKQRKLFREWIEQIIVSDQEKITHHWTLANVDWVN